jgi:hypothetical protein
MSREDKVSIGEKVSKGDKGSREDKVNIGDKLSRGD